MSAVAASPAAASLSPTERLLAEAFAEGALITAQAAARVLGIDEKGLRAMAEAGVIRSVVVGRATRRYTEADLRAFLAGERFGEVREPCPSTSPRRVASGTTTSSSKVVGITARLAQRRAAKPKR